jgi:hypothetical protein
MSSIAYEFRRAALYNPEKSETLFRPKVAYSELQIAIECARLAYVRAEESLADKARLTQALAIVGFDEPTLLFDSATGTEVFAAIKSNDRSAIVACRGTEAGDIKDLVSDLSVINCAWTEKAGRVHSGFAKAARSVLPQIQQWTKQHREISKLILTGHSLGGAVATLLASELNPTRLVTIGSPRVGDHEFAASLQGVAIERIVNCCDAVTDVPPELSMYTHVGQMIYINRDGVVAKEIDESAIKADRKQARVEYLKQYAWKKGAVLIRDLADHAPINYSRAFF